MDPRRQKFLASVLGTESAGLLIKTIDQTPVLEHAIVPRTILAWLQSAPSFEGAILDGVEMVFEKSDSGFTGSIDVHGESYAFEDANVFHVGASVAVALGMEELESDGLRTLDISRLGKTIDLMSKAHRVNVELEKADEDDDKLSDEEFERKYDVERLKARKAARAKEDPKDLDKCSACYMAEDRGYHGVGVGLHEFKSKLGKDEPSAQDLDKALGDSAPPAAPTAAKPRAPGAPKAAVAAAPKMSVPKATSTSTMSLTRSEAGAACGACGGHQFTDDKFVGCLCFEAISKAVKVTSATGAGLVLELDMRTLDQDDVDALADAFKGDTDGK